MYNNQSNQSYDVYNANSQQQQQQPQLSQLQAFETEVKQQNQDNRQEYSIIFYDSLVRADFVQKVYTLLTIELLITIVLIVLGLYTGMQRWLVSTLTLTGRILIFNGMGPETYLFQFPPYLTWVFYVSFLASIFLHCILFCCGNFARKGPISFIIASLYIIFFGFMFSPLCILVAYYCGTAIVWQAWGSTFSTFLGLTLYAFIAKKDISFKVGAIFIFSPNILALVTLLCIWPSYALNICLCCFFTIMYGFFLIWETQLMMGKGQSCSKRLLKLNLSIEDYVFGSLVLFASFNQLIIRAFECLCLVVLGCFQGVQQNKGMHQSQGKGKHHHK